MAKKLRLEPVTLNDGTGEAFELEHADRFDVREFVKLGSVRSSLRRRVAPAISMHPVYLIGRRTRWRGKDSRFRDAAVTMEARAQRSR
jgi:hypothetical protein